MVEQRLDSTIRDARVENRLPLQRAQLPVACKPFQMRLDRDVLITRYIAL